MKINKFSSLAVILIMLLPALVTATVVISYTYNISSTPASPEIYLEPGPNYATAVSLGLTTPGLSANTPIASGTIIDVNGVSGAAYTYLLNVYEIYNNTALSAKIFAWINVTTAMVGATVSLYYSTTALTFNGVSMSGTPISLTAISSSGEIALTGAGTVLYIGFAITGAATSSTNAVISIQYNIG